MSNQELLFDVPPDTKSLKWKLNEFKAKNGVWTHCAPPEIEGRWTALLMPGNPHINPIPYQDAFKTFEPMDIIAGYCRVLDDAGFLVTGETEREAIENLCRNLNIPFEL
jgi:hypothetical protein